MHYYTRHLGDYAKDTGHLSLIEHGVYTVLLDWVYATERTLPEEKDAIYRICRAQNSPEKKAVDKVVAEFFPKRQDGHSNKRACEEIQAFQRKSDSARKANAVRWDSERTPNGLHSDETRTPTRARVPLTNNQYPLKEEEAAGSGDFPESVSDEAVIQFAAHFQGEPASGTPEMPLEWVTDSLKKLNGRREWPRNWRRWLVSCWRADHKTWTPSGIGATQKKGAKNSGEVSASVVAIQDGKRKAQLEAQIRAGKAEVENMKALGDDYRAEKKAVEVLIAELETMEGGAV